jgi:hypothetical protein
LRRCFLMRCVSLSRLCRILLLKANYKGEIMEEYIAATEKVVLEIRKLIDLFDSADTDGPGDGVWQPQISSAVADEALDFIESILDGLKSVTRYSEDESLRLVAG